MDSSEIISSIKRLFLLVLFVTMQSCGQSQMPGYRYSNFDNTPASELAMAVKADNGELVKEIISKNPGIVDFKDSEFNQTLLALSIVNNKRDAFMALLKSGANPNILLGDKDQTPLICAIDSEDDCDFFFVENLLKFKADPNLEIINPNPNRYFDNSFPILKASQSHCDEMAKLLVDHGAKIDCCYFDKMDMLCEGVITRCLSADNMKALRYFVIEKNIKIPDTVYIYGAVDKATQEVYGLEKVLESEHFSYEDFYLDGELIDKSEQRKLRDEIIAYLKRRKN